MKTKKKKTISALLAVLVLGSSVNIGFAETTELPRGVIRIQEEVDSSIPVGAYVYQDEDYEGDFINENFDNIEYDDSATSRTNYTPFKVVDPKDSSNHVFTFSSESKSSTLYPRTSVPLYQGVLTTQLNMNNTPQGLGHTKGYMVFESRAYFAGGLIDIGIKSYDSYFIPSSGRTAYHQYAAYEGNFIEAKSSQGVQVAVEDGKPYIKLTTDSWHTFKFVYNCDSNVGQYIIDNQVISEKSVSRTPSVAAGMKYFVYSKLLPENIVYFDDVKSYWYCPAPGVTATFNAGTDTVTVNSLTEIAEPFTTANLVVKKNDAAAEDVVTAVALSDDKKTVTISVDTTAITDGGYTLELSNVKDVFDQPLELSAPLDLTLPTPEAAVSFDAPSKTVRLDFSTGVTADLTLENIQIFEDGVAASGKVSNIQTSADLTYATFTLDCTQIGLKETTIGVSGLTDKFTQTVNIAAENTVHAPSFTIESSEIQDNMLCVTFSNIVDSFTEDNITVTDADDNAIANAVSDITFSGKAASVVLGGGIKPDKNYTAQISGVTDEYSSTLASTTRDFSASLMDPLYQDDYTDFDVNNFNILQPWSSDEVTISNIKQTNDPLDSANKVVTIFGTGKTDERYPYSTALTIAKKSLAETLRSKTSVNSRTSNLICYETDMYLSDDMLTRLSSRNQYSGLFFGPTQQANGYHPFPLASNTSIVSNGSKFFIASDFSSEYKKVEFEANKWVNFKFVIDHKNLKLSIYIDDECVVYDFDIPNTSYIDSGVAGIGLHYNITAEGGGNGSATDLIPEGEMYFDNTNVYEMKLKAGVTAVAANLSQGNVVVEYNTPVTEAEIGRISVSDGESVIENAITNRVLSEDGLFATLTYSDELVSDTEYFVNFPSDAHDAYGQPISVPNNTYSFEIAKSKSVYVVDNTIASTGGTNPTVTLKLNSYTNGASAWVGVGFYDEFNRLVGCECEDVTITGETDKSYQIQGDCTTAVKYMVFVWDGVDTMVPLQKAETIVIPPAVIE